MVDLPQTATTMGPASTQALELITTGRLAHDGDPVLAEHLANTSVHELGIAETTVRQHLSGLYRRTGCLKYVVGSQEPVAWGPSTRLGPYDREVISKLTDRTDGTIYVSGSGTLVRAMLRDGLVDDLHRFVGGPRTTGHGRPSNVNGPGVAPGPVV